MHWYEGSGGSRREPEKELAARCEQTRSHIPHPHTLSHRECRVEDTKGKMTAPRDRAPRGIPGHASHDTRSAQAEPTHTHRQRGCKGAYMVMSEMTAPRPRPSIVAVRAVGLQRTSRQVPAWDRYPMRYAVTATSVI